MQRLFIKRRLRHLPKLHAKRIPHQYGNYVGSGKKMKKNESIEPWLSLDKRVNIHKYVWQVLFSTLQR